MALVRRVELRNIKTEFHSEHVLLFVTQSGVYLYSLFQVIGYYFLIIEETANSKLIRLFFYYYYIFHIITIYHVITGSPKVTYMSKFLHTYVLYINLYYYYYNINLEIIKSGPATPMTPQLIAL